MNSHDSLLIWDVSGELSSQGCGTSVLWQSYFTSNSDNEVSIPQLVEDHAELLKQSYLSLLYELGELMVNGKSVIDHLEITPGFSYWWMTLLNEKCNFAKSPQTDNIIKLLAFEKWIAGKEYSKIILVSSNSELANALRCLFQELEIKYEWKQIKQKKREMAGFAHFIYDRVPIVVQGFVWLAHHLFTRWRLKGLGLDRWCLSPAKMTFVSYLFHLDINKTKNGQYRSGYWAGLPDMLATKKVQSNWLHIYTKSPLVPTAKAVKILIEQYNQSHSNNQNHVILESFLDLRLVWQVIRQWFRLRKAQRIIIANVRKKCGYYWPLLKKDFFLSFNGGNSMSNLLSKSLFSKAMFTLPQQEKGCYLLENQAWEFGFIHAWRSAGHEQNLIGVPHATVRYWDLRYYFDPRIYESSAKCRMDRPNMVAVNGVVAKQRYVDGSYPVAELCEVEALRYLYIKDIHKQKSISTANSSSADILLVLGDYLEMDTKLLMELLRSAVSNIEVKLKYLVKPHPACPIYAADYPELEMDITNEAIPALISKCSLVLTSSVTSAAMDAYCTGKPVITILDPTKLNLSPVKDCKGVTFVSSADELVKILNVATKLSCDVDQGRSYFHLDADIPRWKALLIENKKSIDNK
ncbi:FIG00766036: hypothetical protein [hydrothermal vent metagenome]|uniref:Uncharacterized protein n=1 Tax=hydrothermal vent metagenome TaxID=652676 RepID=A0A3B0YRB5_9ZZZZ